MWKGINITPYWCRGIVLACMVCAMEWRIVVDTLRLLMRTTDQKFWSKWGVAHSTHKRPCLSNKAPNVLSIWHNFRPRLVFTIVGLHVLYFYDSHLPWQRCCFHQEATNRFRYNESTKVWPFVASSCTKMSTCPLHPLAADEERASTMM